ncbi:MAG: leucyl/phenylalanyl-tRNA--protein transferase [Endomicrobium sp.]|jgi:leucyl/phenylalanyl-tRNA--protein transferase|nr:leucyl/phenylalanyl-tRNA--protein transferase [Endomicrobium sp.]
MTNHSDFPYFSQEERFTFPDPQKAKGSLVAVGGNLSPGMLLSAYEQGIFPWNDNPVRWHSPDPRFTLFPEKLHISSSMKKIFNQKIFDVCFDRDFASVIKNCAQIRRKSQAGTWISNTMQEAYITLHNLGWAHSAESYFNGELAGGCYGLRIGNVFYGESMFAKMPNASKAAFLTLARYLFEDGVKFIDCQVYSRHLESLGGQEISRTQFLKLLKQNL